MRKILHTEGAWCLKEWNDLDHYYYLDHRCPSEPGFNEVNDSDPRFFYNELGDACALCGQKPPEGLQGLFVILEGDCEY